MSATLRSIVVRTTGWTLIASVWAVMGVLVLCFGYLVLIFLSLGFDTLVGTEYAPGYSEEAFDGIPLGASGADVLARLGEPLERDHDGDDGESWYYSRIRPTSDVYWVRSVHLDAADRVVDKTESLYVD